MEGTQQQGQTRKGAYENASLTVFVATQPELRFSPSGKAFTRFAVAINAKEDGLQPTWINMVAFDELAEAIAEKVSKGDLIHATGRLSTHHYNGKQSLEFFIRNLYVKVRPKRQGSAESAATASAVDDGFPPEEDLPF